MRDPETVIWDRAGQGAVLRAGQDGEPRVVLGKSVGRLVQVGQNVLCLLGDERPVVEETVPSRGRP